ncbi:MAG: hypothetical protein ACSHYB_13250 [Roseibacillus sp.]
MLKLDKEQSSALRAGSLILLGFSGFIITIWACGYLPGPVGRTFSLFTGFLWTPTIMEPTLFTLALMSILVLNHHRRKKAGSDYVPLEKVADIDSSHLATNSEPQPPSAQEVSAAVEDAADLGDHKDALRLMKGLPPELLESEEFIAIRLQMAQANDDPNHIRGLSKKLRELNPSHPLLKELS